ncbi:hypothetical protein J2I47_01375 [Fibrella sp. HMF5335]|uniref:Zinc-finger domain-containing protein n=1 Tax=Fibrella rubiginis TaxID=2817060 RepID=A0A939G9Y9_9BACT|nr:hypothetical protein [Fibrella rubiginis]MBO0935187.1 hypothetical protein [Fibrella rubiginis]
MSHSAYNQPLTLDELRAYQAGQLSAAEQHRVERLLLENPFYADALEGLEAIQQAGSSLQRQTRSLHESLQERLEEAATPRRLMPLWVASLVASVLLVLSVTFYLIYTTNPVGTAARKGNIPAITDAVQPHLEPGTVLLDVNDLGTAETPPVVQPATSSAKPMQLAATAKAHRSVVKTPRVLLSTVAPVSTLVEVAATGSTTGLPAEPHLSATPTEEQQAIRRARTINPERAFDDWPPAVKL